MKFTKGQSGNPGGRPKGGDEVKELARSHGPAAIARLVDWLKSDNPKASVSAASVLLDRGFGKAHQTTELTIDDKRDASDWTRAELVAFLNNARDGSERAAEADGRGEQPNPVH